MGQLANQISFFDSIESYEYIIDTSSLLAQKTNDTHPRSIQKSMWRDIDNLIRDKVIVISSEIIDEVEDEDVKNLLLSLDPDIIKVTENIQRKVQAVVQKCPKLLNFAKEKSSGDAFLIATAMEYGLTVITEEKQNTPNRIPQVCEEMSVRCINLWGLCEERGWEY